MKILHVPLPFYLCRPVKERVQHFDPIATERTAESALVDNVNPVNCSGGVEQGEENDKSCGPQEPQGGALSTSQVEQCSHMVTSLSQDTREGQPLVNDTNREVNAVDVLSKVLSQPKVEYMHFDGDHVNYISFMHNFEACPESTDNSGNLQLLIQHCRGKAHMKKSYGSGSIEKWEWASSVRIFKTT